MFCRTCESPEAVYNIKKCNGKASLAFSSSQCLWWRSPAPAKCVQTKWFITDIKNPLYLLITTINQIAQRVGIQQNTTESGTTQPTRTTRHSTVRHTAATQCNTTCHSSTRHGMAQQFKDQHGITWHDDTTQYIKEPPKKTRYSTRSQRAAWHNTAPLAQQATVRHGTTQHGTNIDRFLLAQFHLYVHKSDTQRFLFIPLFIYPHIVATSAGYSFGKSKAFNYSSWLAPYVFIPRP